MLIFLRQSITKKTKSHIWSHQRIIYNHREYNCSLWGISYRGCRIFRQWKTVIKDVQKCFKLILKDGKHGESQRWQEGKGTAKCAKECDLVIKTALCCYFSQNFILRASCGNGKKNLSRSSRGAPTTRRCTCCVLFCVGHSARLSRA